MRPRIADSFHGFIREHPFQTLPVTTAKPCPGGNACKRPRHYLEESESSVWKEFIREDCYARRARRTHGVGRKVCTVRSTESIRIHNKLAPQSQLFCTLVSLLKPGGLRSVGLGDWLFDYSKRQLTRCQFYCSCLSSEAWRPYSDQISTHRKARLILMRQLQ